MRRTLLAVVLAMGLLFGSAATALADPGGKPNDNARFGQCVAMCATHCESSNFGEMVSAMARGEACPCPH